MSYLRCEEIDDLLILRFTEPKLLCEAEVTAVGEALIRFGLQAGETGKDIIVDFGGLMSASSAIMGKIVLFNKCAVERGVRLRFRNPTPGILELFRRTGLDKFFSFCTADDPDPFGTLRWEPDLFEVRNDVLEVLQENGFDWMEHFQSVGLLHKWHGIEVTGIREKNDADSILRLLMRMYPSWHPG